jgi:hypothetical protein
MELKDLVGQHELSGVDMVQILADPDGYSSDPRNCCRFILDGKTYTVTEDENDGYRSSMKDIVEGGEPVVNRFEPQKVLCHMQTEGRCSSTDDILVMRDIVTGKDVLSVGTSDVDVYYPSFISDFNPEHMACNASPPSGSAE